VASRGDSFISIKGSGKHPNQGKRFAQNADSCVSERKSLTVSAEHAERKTNSERNQAEANALSAAGFGSPQESH
jgi:hypothetical protein